MSDLETAARALLAAWDAAGLVEQMRASSELAGAVADLRAALRQAEETCPACGDQFADTMNPNQKRWCNRCQRWVPDPAFADASALSR
jgi:formamidopyrimidine-DNA glycosylase